MCCGYKKGLWERPLLYAVSMKGFNPAGEPQTLGDKSRDWLLLKEATLIGLELTLKPKRLFEFTTPALGMAIPLLAAALKLAHGRAG